MLKLRFSDQRQEPVWVVDKSFTIGSADDNHLVINDASVSPQHARIVLANDVYILHDLGSHTGTFVNGQRITQRPLGDGDLVQIGDVVLEILDPAAAGNQPEWSLVACSSWLAGQEFPIRSRNHSQTVKIGRANHCDLIFPGTHLSREHVQLTLTEQEVQVQDLNSANGTFINELRVTEGVVYSGDQLRLDVYSFKIYGPGRRPAAQPPLSQHEQLTRIRPPQQAKSVVEATSDASSKQWKTRPTSPGNRAEAPVIPTQYNFTTKFLAAVLSLAVIVLALYLLMG